MSLKTGAVKTVAQGGYFGRYLPSGHLTYVHQGTLFAARFDLDRMEARGAAIPVLNDIWIHAGNRQRPTHFLRRRRLTLHRGQGEQHCVADGLGRCSREGRAGMAHRQCDLFS